jgi:hypothetical protein
MGRPQRLLLAGLLPALMVLAAPLQAAPAACPDAVATRPIEDKPSGTGRPPGATASAAPAPGEDYRQRLRPTGYGWPRLDHWCVWVEPAATGGAGQRWDALWLDAVERALDQWTRVLTITRVEDPAAAQVRILRRRPPLLRKPDGRTRASHGRALLSFQQVRRGQQPQSQLEPLVEILISPGQRPQAIQATSLHELGHGFGLWGHSDQASDVMAAVPGAIPVLELSRRDLLSLGWLQGQASLFGSPWPAATPTGKSATAPPPPPGRRGD